MKTSMSLICARASARMRRIPSSTASSGRAGVVSSLRVLRASPTSSTISVNVPPISTASRTSAPSSIPKLSALIVKTGDESAAISVPSTALATLRPALLLGTYAIGKACLRRARSEQECKRRFATFLDLERQEIVGAGTSEIDRSDRDLPARGRLHEAEAGVDHQRRTDDQHGVGLLQMTLRGGNDVARHVLAEEHDIGLEGVAAGFASRHPEGREIRVLQIGVAIRRIRGIERQPLRICTAKRILEFVARRLPAAAHAADQIKPAMQIDHLPVTCGLMQPVDILGQEQLALPVGLDTSERMMRSVRPGLAEPPPSDQAARPIAPARMLLGHEGLEVDRLGPLPVAVAVAIVGDARIRATAGTGQHEQPFVPGDEIFKRTVCHGRRCSLRHQVLPDHSRPGGSKPATSFTKLALPHGAGLLP